MEGMEEEGGRFSHSLCCTWLEELEEEEEREEGELVHQSTEGRQSGKERSGIDEEEKKRTTRWLFPYPIAFRFEKKLLASSAA